MIYYLVLLASFLIIFFFTYKIWKKTKDFSFILGLSLLYYWTLGGAWFFIGDQLSGEKGKDFGLHYYYLFQKMFEVNLDKNYIYTIILYSIFIMSIQLTILLFFKYKKYNRELNENFICSFKINHYFIIIISFLSAIISFYILRNEILYALTHDLSVYTITRSTTNRLFTIHQVFNLIAVFSLIFGIVVYLSDKDGVYIYSKKNLIKTILYIILTFFVIFYISMLGNKHELMFSGIFGVLFLILNNKKFIIRKLIIILLIIVIPLYLNDASRYLTPQIATKCIKYFGSNNYNYKQEKSTDNIDYSSALKCSSLSFLFSNEMFCGHFSMYGVIKNNIAFTYGSSIKSFFASFIPIFFYRNRPHDIYFYYASQLKLQAGQGYTINHSTGWYLNFGVIGIILGAILFGFTWIIALSFYLFDFRKINKYIILFLKIMPALFVAYIPFIIRAGPEGYKSLIFEVIVIPFIIIIFTVRQTTKQNLKY